MKIRSRAVKAGILASGKILTGLAGLASLAVLSRIFDKHEYATYRQTLLAYAFLAPLLTLGLPKALFYFLPDEQRRPRAVLAENLLPLLLMGAVFACFLLFGGQYLLAARFNNPELARTLMIIAPYPLFLLPTLAVPACLLARDRAGSVAIYLFLSRAAMVALVIAAVIIWPTPDAALWATTGGALLALAPALWLMYRSCGDNGELAPRFSGSWQQVKYSLPLGVAAMIGAFSMNLDKVIVSAMTDTQTFAIYVNGAMQIPLVGMVTGSIAAVILPEMASAFKAGRIRDSLEMWKRAGSKCALIIFPAMVFLFVMAEEVMTTLYSSAYIASATPFRIYLLMLPTSIVRFDSVYMAANKGNFILVRAVVMLVINGAVSIVLVSRYGYLGAAVATVSLVFLLALPYNAIQIRRIMNVPMRSLFPMGILGRIMAAACLAAIPSIAIKYCVHLPSPAVLLASSIAYGVSLLLIYHYSALLPIDALVRTARRRISKYRSTTTQKATSPAPAGNTPAPTS